MGIDDRNYWYDSRVRAGERASRRQFDERNMTLAFELENGTGEQETITLPARFEVCPTCEGRGSHVNPSIDAGGITGSEWAEWGDEERESYRRGAYDVACYDCAGQRVVPEVDADAADPEALKRVRAWEREQAAFDAMCAAERAMGA